MTVTFMVQGEPAAHEDCLESLPEHLCPYDYCHGWGVTQRLSAEVWLEDEVSPHSCKGVAESPDTRLLGMGPSSMGSDVRLGT